MMDRRRALMGANKSDGRLPSEYQEVEWIGVANSSTTPTAYLDAGNVIRPGDMVKAEIKPYSRVGSYDSPIGGSINAGTYWYVYFNMSLTQIVFYKTGKLSYTSSSATIGEWDELLFSMTGAEEIPLNILRSGLKRYAYNGKIKSLSIEDGNGSATHIYVPCYRKTDGVIGMYDLIGRSFLINAGTGDFTKGADVN